MTNFVLELIKSGTFILKLLLHPEESTEGIALFVGIRDERQLQNSVPTIGTPLFDAEDKHHTGPTVAGWLHQQKSRP